MGEITRIYSVAGRVYEDELPENFPYKAIYPYSYVEGVRVFPVFAPVVVDVDDLAQFIRRVDGSNKMGAAALAEEICGFLYAQGRNQEFER